MAADVERETVPSGVLMDTTFATVSAPKTKDPAPISESYVTDPWIVDPDPSKVMDGEEDAELVEDETRAPPVIERVVPKVVESVEMVVGVVSTLPSTEIESVVDVLVPRIDDWVVMVIGPVPEVPERSLHVFDKVKLVPKVTRPPTAPPT